MHQALSACLSHGGGTLGGCNYSWLHMWNNWKVGREREDRHHCRLVGEVLPSVRSRLFNRILLVDDEKSSSIGVFLLGI